MNMRPHKIVILSGLSGAGKTTGVHALEDQGFYCVDNLPVGLMRPFLDLCERGDGIQKIALVIDIREGEFLAGAADMIRELKAHQYPVEVLFLEASEETLVRRYQETRRKHPAAHYADTLRGAIIKERELLAPLRQTAEGVIDTSSLNVHQLRRAIKERYQSREGQALSLCLMSFGFKHGLPPEADMVLDVRFLPNPYFTGLRHKTGQDAEVSAYALKEASSFLHLTESLLRELLPRYQHEGRTSFTLAIGCTGGKHRSVAVVEEISKRLGDITRASVVHRDIEKV
jgi:UPF0042 nucleotide-binding protein